MAPTLSICTREGQVIDFGRDYPLVRRRGRVHDAGMSHSKGLAQSPIVAFVMVREPEPAKAFYRDTLGLRMIEEELPFAVVFDANGVMLRLAIAPQHVPLPGTVLGWQVRGIEDRVREFAAAGVVFERFTGMPQDALGIWTTPTGAKVAWFKDPDGNLLSLSQHP